MGGRDDAGDEEPRIEVAEATRRIAAYDQGVQARARQTFAVDWTGPLLYDLVIDTETIGVMTAVGPVLGLIGGGSRRRAGGGHVRLAGVIESETVFRRPVR